MNQYLDPIAAARDPKENLIRYLLTAYPLRDPHLKSGFKELLEKPGNIFQAPYVEGSQPYKTGHNLSQLVAKNLLHPGILEMFDGDRPLYQHQEAAVTTFVEKQQNFVVATGTGSGKTECFLIPMMDHLLKNPASGVQALILYPMNALVNDQVKRLRQLLVHQGDGGHLLRFGFYTSRTERETRRAVQALQDELAGTDYEELRELFTPKELEANKGAFSRKENLEKAALEKITRIQAISREEIWENPPQILVTNYSMLEHMLIRPDERQKIFEQSPNFKLLVVDEAHSYNGSTGTEVSMLIKRFKAAVGIRREGTMRGIATSATLGDRSDQESINQVKAFARDLFSEPFDAVIWGDRVDVDERLGKPYDLPKGLEQEDIYEYFSVLELPALRDGVEKWQDQLSCLVPPEQITAAIAKVATVTNPTDKNQQFLWHALQGHPIFHNLIRCLSKNPQPWETLSRSLDLWGDLPLGLDGEVAVPQADLEMALARLVQLGTLAKRNPDELPLAPVRLHLLFRSIEGLYGCVNPDCEEAPTHPQFVEKERRYGKLFLSSKTQCDCCGSAVIELGSCRKCGQAYGLTNLEKEDMVPLPRSLEAMENKKTIHVLTAGPLDSITHDEGEEDDESNNAEAKSFFLFKEKQNNGWIAQTDPRIPEEQKNIQNAWIFHFHQPKDAKNLEGGLPPSCPACNAQKRLASPISRFVSYTDAPLEVMLDSLFELLPEENQKKQPEAQLFTASKRKLLTFSDGRQDAAFFASDFQRTHTEVLYRQLIWRAFQSVQNNGIADIEDVEKELIRLFSQISIPHPDRDSEAHHRSYVAHDQNDNEASRLKTSQCEKKAKQRAREILLREFGLPSAKRFSIEALGLLACHLEAFDPELLVAVTEKFEFSNRHDHAEAQIFLTGLTDILRLYGAVNLEGASNYFPETGGVKGGLPSRLDTQGRSLWSVKLSRQEKEKNTIGFLWKEKADGEPSKRQNQLVSFYLNFLEPRFHREASEKKSRLKNNIFWLFEEFKNRGYLEEYKSGRQLNWNLLNLQKTKEDWYQCGKCQQIFHVPLLAQVFGESKLNVNHCRASRCDGKLQPFQPESLEDHHYRHLITERQILPLRSQEHTAQLGTQELADRENRFRQGKINLLSCSTTLEMGVDIGELQAVALRNFPPHVSNYQQRAGRAGRRTDGVALTLMYGQRRPHDRYYFEEPIQLINGKNQVPRLDPQNFTIQKRHIRAELLAQFLIHHRGQGAEKIDLAEFLGLSDDFEEMNEPPPHALVQEFLGWLQTPEAQDFTQECLSLLDSENENTAKAIAEDFGQALNQFIQEQLNDWNGLVEVLNATESAKEDLPRTERGEKRKLQRNCERLEDRLAQFQKERLHDKLAQASVLPIYGFPIDVVQLYTRDSGKDQYNYNGKHRLMRDRRLALGEYAPGQEVVVDDRVHRSVGVFNAKDLPTRYYWVCGACNYFHEATTQEEIIQTLGGKGNEQCPLCQSPPHGTFKTPKPYKVPKAFMTDWAEPPKVTPYRKPTRQPTSQVFLAQEGDDAQPHTQEFFELVVGQGGQFFLSNQGGYKQGFKLCQWCARDLSDSLPTDLGRRRRGRSRKGQSHQNPITGRECDGLHEPNHLGHLFRSDLVKIRFTPQAQAPKLFGQVVHHDGGGEIHSQDDSEKETQSRSGMDFWRSLTYGLLAAAAQVIDVPRAELDGLFRPLAGSSGQAEIILYDNVPGGAGYSRRIAQQFGEILQRALTLVESCQCDRSCYDCLRTYTNQPFHGELDRGLIEGFLRKIVDQVQPDPALQGFAPHSYRVPSDRLETTLDQFLTRGNRVIVCVPQLHSPITLKRLTQLIDHLQEPLTLMVHHLPPKNDHPQTAVLRKRLGQWLDLGKLHLYQSDRPHPGTLWVKGSQSLAIQWPENTDHFFQTQSDKGVCTVEQRLKTWVANATALNATDFDDPDNWVIFPDRTWANLTLEQLREKLKLQEFLAGNTVAQLFYSDRYFSPRAAQIFVDLFKGPWISSQSQIRIHTQAPQYGTTSGVGDRQALEAVLKPLPQCELMIKRPVNASRLPHGRFLEMTLTNQNQCRILWDQGFDFVTPDGPNHYRCKAPSYVVWVKKPKGDGEP